MDSAFSHCGQETLATENVLTGCSPHGHFEHLLADGAVEIIFAVGRGRGELLGRGGGRGTKAMGRQRLRWRWRPWARLPARTLNLSSSADIKLVGLLYNLCLENF